MFAPWKNVRFVERVSHERKKKTAYSFPSDYDIDQIFEDLIYDEKDYPLVCDSEAIQNIKDNTLYQESDINREKLTTKEAFNLLLNEYTKKEEAKRETFISDIDHRKAEITEHLGPYILYQETLKEIERTKELYSQIRGWRNRN